MNESLIAGTELTERHVVDKDRTIDFMGDECRVYATPFLLYDIEMTCRNLLMEHCEAGEDSVGTHVELTHTGPTLLGMWVDITVTVTEVKGRAVSFDITARDALEQVATGKHSRFVVDVDTTAQRLKGKLAKAQAL